MRARRLTVCAQTGGCICRLTVCSQAVCAGRRLYMQACGERKQQTSSAMTGGERGGICGLMCARKWGRGAQACVHKFQKPEKRLAAVVPRCADVRIHKCRPRCMTAAGEALCRLTACEIRRYRCRRRALSPACGGAKGGAVSQTCIRKRTLSLGKQTAARAGGGRKQTLSAITGDDLDKIAHLRADGRLHTQAWCANECRPQCATAADEPPRRSTGV